MTAARQQRKRPFLTHLVLAIALGSGIFAPWTLKAATDIQLAVNPDTGRAISGFDPVAYFTDGKAIRQARYSIEQGRGGLVLQQRGNRGVFALHSRSIRRGSGGYDPVAIGRDRSVPGHPPVLGRRRPALYLFEQTRLALLTEPGGIIAAAERKMARAGPQSGAVSRRQFLTAAAFPGSPQAMNAGTRKFSAARP